MSTTEPTLERDDSGPLQRVARFGGTVGLGLVFVGIVIIFLGWNGAASFGTVPQQFPYLISGGVLGLGVMVVGSAMVVVENQRKDRSAMQASINELRETLEKLQLSSGPSGAASSNPGRAMRGGSDLVVAGEYDYVAADSLLAEGREDGQVMTRAEAEAAGLVPSRVDFPDEHDIPATKAKQAEEKARKAARAAAAIPADEFAPEHRAPEAPAEAESVDAEPAAQAAADHTTEIPIPADDAPQGERAGDSDDDHGAAAETARPARRSPMAPRQVRTRRSGVPQRPGRAGTPRRKLEAAD